MIRQLEERDAEQYRQVRLRALREEPEAFGSAYEEQADLPLSYFVERIRPTDDRVTLGAFDGETLVGMVTLVREHGIKDRHKGASMASRTDTRARSSACTSFRRRADEGLGAP